MGELRKRTLPPQQEKLRMLYNQMREVALCLRCVPGETPQHGDQQIENEH